MIGVDLQSSSSSGGGGGRGNCNVAFLTKDITSMADVTEPELISSHGFTVIELGWYFDVSVPLSANAEGCVFVAGNYNVNATCGCEYPYLLSLQ